MFLLLNKSNVIIDIVDNIRYVYKNTNGLTILCYEDKAEGYIGSDNETIYAKMGMQFQPSFTDIASTALVNEIPSGVIPRSWKYVDNEFIKNEDVHPIEYNSERQVVLTNDTSNIVYLAMMANVTLQQS